VPEATTACLQTYTETVKLMDRQEKFVYGSSCFLHQSKVFCSAVIARSTVWARKVRNCMNTRSSFLRIAYYSVMYYILFSFLYVFILVIVYYTPNNSAKARAHKMLLRLLPKSTKTRKQRYGVLFICVVMMFIFYNN